MTVKEWRVREQDLKKLREPYPETAEFDMAFAQAIGAGCDKMHQLAKLVASDLDPTDFGIGWWASGSLDLHRRILIGDYLISVSRAVQTNMTEARLHLLEADDAWIRLSGNIRTALRTSGMPIDKPISPADELWFYLGPLHATGAIRALASAMDCLAGVIVGTVGLPVNIVRADWSDLEKIAARTNSGLLSEQMSVTTTALDAVGSAGPSGWLDWLLDMRNMLVHRGRRLVTYNIRDLGAGNLIVAVPSPIDAVVADYLLPSDPQSTDADVWRLLGPDQSLLTEPAGLTIAECVRSVKAVIESVAGAATELWAARKLAPTLIEQPERQWPTVVAASSTSFRGYSPGASPVIAGTFSTGPESVDRLVAAGVTGNNKRIVWP